MLKLWLGFKYLPYIHYYYFLRVTKFVKQEKNVYMYQFLFASVIFCDLKSF